MPYVYVKLIGAGLFIPICLITFICLRGKFERIGILMLLTYVLCFVAHFISGRETLIQHNEGHIFLAEVLQVIFTMLSVNMQYYFTMELKRVRAWLECRHPLELEIRLKQIRNHKVLFAVLFSLFFITYCIDFALRDKYPEISFDLSLTVNCEMLIIIGHIVYHSVSQYLFFIKRRMAYHVNTFEDGNMPAIEKLAIASLAFIQFLFAFIFLLILGNSIIVLTINLDDKQDSE